MRNIRIEEDAKETAEFLQSSFQLKSNPSIGIVLGTGFDGVLDYSESIAFKYAPGFSHLSDCPEVPGHALRFVHGKIGGKELVGLRGRIHLNQSPGDPELFKMVRLQIEALLQLGVKKLILTCAAGALPNTKLKVGDLVVVDGFVTLFAPQMPLWAGEFCSPEDTLSKRLKKIALAQRKEYPGSVSAGGYAMLLGPYFEGRKYDKLALSNTGASVVGMSILPEACIAALYSDVEVLALAFVTNDAKEVHSHKENIWRAQGFKKPLTNFLKKVIVSC